jgi:hypothetical protein
VLPTLKLRMIPEQRCTKCGAFGYVSDVSRLCCWCLAPGLAIFHRTKARNLAERLERNAREYIDLAEKVLKKPLGVIGWDWTAAGRAAKEKDAAKSVRRSPEVE